MSKKLYIALCFCLLNAACFARKLVVGNGSQYATITKAIARANKGDTVLVKEGVYKEKNIIIKTSIALIGVGFPVLDGEHKYEILSINADDVIVKGFKLIHSGVSSIQDIAAIKIYNARNIVLSHNNLEDTFFGIYSQGGSNCLIAFNQLKAYAKTEQQSGNGIHCWKSDSMQIIGNSITGHRDGIYFEFVTHSTIRRNLSFGNMRYGLHFMFSHNDAYIGNTFQNNGAGVSVMYTHGVKMFNNLFEENWGDAAYGLLLKEISDSHISGNKFIQNTSGICMEGASRIKVDSNEFRQNGWGVKIQASCIDNVLENNNFLSNTFDIATNGTLVMNRFDHNYWDRYEGYDLNKDHLGDIPYRPVSLFSMIVEKNPSSMMLFRSFMSSLLDKSEKLLPTLTPENLRDNHPFMKPIRL